MNNRAISIEKEGRSKQKVFKEDMYDNLKSMMEKGELFLLDDDNIRLSLSSIQWEFVERKGITRVNIFGDYSHITEGLVRAAWLAKKEKINKIDHDDANSITTLENIMIEYDVKTSELIKTAQPVIDKHNKNKDDISELYKSIITEYSNYTFI